MDAGEVNGAPFNNGLGGEGFDAVRGRGSRSAGLPRGNGEIPVGVGRLLWGFPRGRARARWRGHRAETILVAVALGTTYGSMFRLAPEARLDDGLFGVVWSRGDQPGRGPPAHTGGARRALPRHAKVHLARAREVEVEECRPTSMARSSAPARAFRARVLPEPCA